MQINKLIKKEILNTWTVFKALCDFNFVLDNFDNITELKTLGIGCVTKLLIINASEKKAKVSLINIFDPKNLYELRI